MSGEDRRKYQRVILNKPVILADESENWETELIDISLKGVLLEKPDGFSSENEGLYSIDIPLGQQGGPDIEMEAQLVHEEADELGFCWEHIDDESFDHLQRLLLYNLGDADEINRELSVLFG